MLQGFCDAGDQRDRKSTSGYLFTFANCLIVWCSKKQSSKSLSLTEVEYVSMSMAAYISLSYHFVKDLIKNNKICLKYICTSEQPADMLTKYLSKELIVKYLKQCGVGNITVK